MKLHVGQNVELAFAANDGLVKWCEPVTLEQAIILRDTVDVRCHGGGASRSLTGRGTITLSVQFAPTSIAEERVVVP